jgi:hypothetical protein
LHTLRSHDAVILAIGNRVLFSPRSIRDKEAACTPAALQREEHMRLVLAVSLVLAQAAMTFTVAQAASASGPSAATGMIATIATTAPNGASGVIAMLPSDLALTASPSGLVSGAAT